MIKIKKVIIESFRNLHDFVVALDCKNCEVYGNNKLGKTNILNSIYWCLTGADLDDNCTAINNVDREYASSSCEVKIYDEGKEDEVSYYLNAVDVTVILFNDDPNCKNQYFAVRRSLECDVDFCSTSTTIYCDSYSNDSNCLLSAVSSSKFETTLFNFLGISSLAINKVKDFNLLKFLLNPLYIINVKPSAFRQFIISNFIHDVDHYSVLNSYFYEDQKKMIDEFDGDLVVCYNEYSNNLKKLKAVYESLCTVSLWLIKNGYINNDNYQAPMTEVAIKFHDEYDPIWDEYKTLSSKVSNLSVAIKNLNKKYSDVIKNLFNSNLVILETNDLTSAVKEVCYPTIKRDDGIDIPIFYGSTSERIICATRFLADVYRLAGINPLPVLIDECETMDDDSIKKLTSSFSSQIITARVESGNPTLKYKEF